MSKFVALKYKTYWITLQQQPKYKLMKVQCLFFTICILVITGCSRDADQFAKEESTDTLGDLVSTSSAQAQLEINNKSNDFEVELWEALRSKVTPPGSPPSGNLHHIDSPVASTGKSIHTHEVPINCTNDPTCTTPCLNPGEWEFRASLEYRESENSTGTVIHSNIVNVNILYPEVAHILTNLDSDFSQIKSDMESLWQQTKDLASSSGVYEMGFSIYVETDMTGRVDFIVDNITTSRLFRCGEEPTIKIPNTEHNYESYQYDGDRFLVTYFHTHPPHTYCTTPCRPTHASPADLDNAETKKTPGILMDYDVSSLCYDHNKDIDYKILSFGSYERREYIPSSNN